VYDLIINLYAKNVPRKGCFVTINVPVIFVKKVIRGKRFSKTNKSI